MEHDHPNFERKKISGFLEEQVEMAARVIAEAFRRGNKLLVCGNGGSSSDSDHIVGELMKSFERPRPLNPEVQQKLKDRFGEQGDVLAENLQQGLPAISLSAHTALLTAIANDMGGDYIFAQQVAGYGIAGDILLAISTSGNSQNICGALMTAKASGLFTIGVTGESGGRMKEYCDVLVAVPGQNTAPVQEFHLPVFHAICRMVEMNMFG